MKKPKPTKDTGNSHPDYYWENGLLVFTEAYHRRRGYCCQSKCRHCPYDNSKSKPSKNL
ncbi:MAG: hypothetical protein KF775_13260 [Cyclobacteriaceae bacterium]|nr:hypothetical protein [Cyclobacteriaceae bacterium]